MASIENGLAANQLGVDPTSKAARSWLYDPAGHPIASVLDTAGTYRLATAIQQNVLISTNTSGAPIANGGSYTGPVESTLGVNSIQINTYIDRPHTVQVYQGLTAGTMRLMPGGTYTVPANQLISRTFQATSAYWQIVVTNNGATPSTVTDINCALCPTANPLPPALTSGGNLSICAAAEWQNNGLVTGLYAYSGFRIVGSAASPQHLLAINNPALNTKYIAIRQLFLVSDSTVAQLTISQQLITSKPAALPTGGTALTAFKRRSIYGGASAVVLCGASGDGLATPAIVATPGTSMWQQFLDRQGTAVGNIQHLQYNLLPDAGVDLRQDVLAPGESMLVTVTGSVPATTGMIVNLSTTEFQAL